MTQRTWLRRTTRAVLTALLVASAMAVAATSASAHTDFDSSDPADGAVLAGPLAEILVTFTAPADESGAGIQVLDSTGAVLPSSVTQTGGGAVFVLTPEEPLGAGEYGVRWEVQAADAHPIDGSFRFTVSGGSAPASTPAPSTALGTTAPPGEAEAPGTGGTDDPPDALGTVLTDEAPGSSRLDLGGWGRPLVIVGTILGLGSLSALLWVVRGRRRELRGMVSGIQACGLLVAAGGLLELVGPLVSASPGLGELLAANHGIAAVLTVLGGLAVVVGFRRGSGTLHRDTSASPAPDPARGTERWRWSPSASTAAGLVGLVVIVASSWFDGHTVARGPWPVHAAVNVVHVVAAGAWAGGVVAVTVVVLRRRRRREPTGVAELIIRFSTVASAALVPVLLAGAALAVIVLDSPSGLVTSPWGRILLAKSAAVGVVVALGTYNHVRLRPALAQDPGSASLGRAAVRTLSVEAILILGVLLLTGWLVAAAT